MSISEAIVIGGSAGSISAMNYLVPAIPATISIPIVVALHTMKGGDNFFLERLKTSAGVKVAEAHDKALLLPGTIYFAPPDYHLLIEYNRHLSLSCDPEVTFSRPSIDVLFESASRVYREHLTGVLLTGGGCDGVSGLKSIRALGGTIVVENPSTANTPFLPENALKELNADYILTLEEISEFIKGFSERG